MIGFGLDLLFIPYRENFGCLVTFRLYFIPYGEGLGICTKY